MLRSVDFSAWGWLTIGLSAILGLAAIATDVMLSRGWVGAVVSVLGAALALLMFPIERLLLMTLSESWIGTVVIGSLVMNAVAISMIIGGVVIGWCRRSSRR